MLGPGGIDASMMPGDGATVLDRARLDERSDGDRGLIGREKELARIQELVDSSGAALVVLGEAGVGKSSLAAFAKEYARTRGIRTLCSTGVESEGSIPFAALADVLLPLSDHYADLPPVQREALEVRLALSEGAAGGPLAACAGALGTLSAASERQPVLVVVDDFQWVDQDSAQVLGFVARRAASEGFVVLLTVRDEPDAARRVLDLPTLHLGRLSSHECAELVERTGVSVSPSTLLSIVEATGGNPLAMVEYCRSIAVGHAPTGLHEPHMSSAELHPSLERTWGRLWLELPGDSRAALFLVCASAGLDGRTTAAALDLLGLSADALAPAEARSLVSWHNDRCQLRHPLLRAVVMARTPSDLRARAYRALAAATTGYLHALYLAAEVAGPDPSLADKLVLSADEARRRDGLAAAARALHRSSELTENGALRAERLLAAATDAYLAGDVESATRWSLETRGLRDDPRFVLEAGIVACRARTWLGQPTPAMGDMLRIAEALRPSAPQFAVAALAEASVPAFMLGRVHDALRAAEWADEIVETSPELLGEGAALIAADSLLAASFTITGQIPRARKYLQAAIDRTCSPDGLSDAYGRGFLAQTHMWGERHHDARSHLQAVIELGRRLGSPSILSYALAVSGETWWWTGDWTAAAADATESYGWAVEYDQPALIGYSMSILARIEASRGDADACRTHCEQSVRDLEPRGVGAIRTYADHSLGLAALSVGDLPTAVHRLTASWQAAVAQGMGNPVVVPAAGDLAEALARAGRDDECCDVLDWLDATATSTGLDYPVVAAARARGILAADPSEAAPAFAAAKDAAKDSRSPVLFEEARTLLAEGEVLRRARRPGDARTVLLEALTRFQRLGAHAWASRASNELAATGGASHTQRRPGRPQHLQTLTPQEWQVANAASRGLNNIEIAGSLFMSRKTVEAHLSRTYRKVGVRSRTELTRMLLENGANEPS
jgi:DNA-binding NarL/FixJ family response regulator